MVVSIHYYLHFTDEKMGKKEPNHRGIKRNLPKLGEDSNPDWL